MFRHGEPRVRQHALTNSGRDYTKESITTIRARQFAENFRALVDTNAPLEHQGDTLSWWYEATRDASNNMAQYLDDTVLVNADDEVIARLQRLALLVGALPHWM